MDEALADGAAGATHVLHPISELHTILRTSLLSSLLEIFAINQHHPLPQRIFAAGDVVVDKKTRMHLAAASIHSGASFSEIRSVIDAVLRELDIPGRDHSISGWGSPARKGR